MSKKEIESSRKYGLGEINSYSLAQGMVEFLMNSFNAFVFFFYETEILLNVGILALIFTLFTLWDAINDPLIGNLTDRPFKFTRKLGRRLPWVLIGAFPWAILYIFIYMPPNVNPNTQVWTIFFYLLIILCAFDTFLTLWTVNSEALFPAKFRDLKQRRKISGLKAFWGIIGIAMGIIIPPLFIEYNNRGSYITQAVILSIIAICLTFLIIPGHRESKELIDEYFATGVEHKERIGFIKALVSALKKKNFMLVVVLQFFYYILTGLLLASMNYFLKYNLKEDPEAFIVVMGSYLLVSLITIPIWVKISHKVNNNKKMITNGAFLMAIMTIPLIFVNSLLFLIITAAMIGFAGGIFFVMQDAVFADVVDEAVILDTDRREGTYFGIKIFLSRLSSIFVVLSIAIVHIMTGFNPSATDQTPLALIGIRIHIGVIPVISLLIGAFIFWKWYDLTPEKTVQIQAKIKELGL
ncbi:MAG: MFS transporter [Promethearchaeota archaeon]|nr:MAG: MFS transporter [Candidatus Lokiarchaeota archaeon]